MNPRRTYVEPMTYIYLTNRILIWSYKIAAALLYTLITINIWGFSGVKIMFNLYVLKVSIASAFISATEIPPKAREQILMFSTLCVQSRTHNRDWETHSCPLRVEARDLDWIIFIRFNNIHTQFTKHPARIIWLCVLISPTGQLPYWK